MNGWVPLPQVVAIWLSIVVVCLVGGADHKCVDEHPSPRAFTLCRFGG